MADLLEPIVVSRQLEQVRRLLAFICAWICGGFTAATAVAVYLAANSRLDWTLVLVPLLAGAGAYLSVLFHEGISWNRDT